MSDLRRRLVETSLAWERTFGIAPSITSVLSEFDAAMLVGFTAQDYSAHMQGRTAVQRGYDFVFKGDRYQVKATRPSGKPGSFVTKVPKATNYEWERLVWINYSPQYEIKEAWLWDVSAYISAFDTVMRLSPAHLRQGQRLV